MMSVDGDGEPHLTNKVWQKPPRLPAAPGHRRAEAAAAACPSPTTSSSSSSSDPPDAKRSPTDAAERLATEPHAGDLKHVYERHTTNYRATSDRLSTTFYDTHVSYDQRSGRHSPYEVRHAHSERHSPYEHSQCSPVAAEKKVKEDETPTSTSAKACGKTVKITSSLEVTPAAVAPLGSPGQQRSFTSVNLTLRPPSDVPQAPIDVSSANARLTYSTSSFDSSNGLESRLQITVGPTGGSVSSYRRQRQAPSAPRPRPRSLHLYTDENRASLARPPDGRASMPDLSLPPVVQRQQSKIDRLRIELRAERGKLVAMQEEVGRLEESESRPSIGGDEVDGELERQLAKEIRHLRGQCERLTIELDQRTAVEQQHQQHVQVLRDEAFYRNIYVGQRHPPNFGRPHGGAGVEAAALDAGDSHWSCPKCTFHNHPSMRKCEQCDMPHFVHGTLRNLPPVSAAPGEDIHIHVTPRIARRVMHSWVI